MLNAACSHLEPRWKPITQKPHPRAALARLTLAESETRISGEIRELTTQNP